MLSGFRRGIIRVLFSLLGIVTGILLASWNYIRLAGALHSTIGSNAAAQIVAFLAILIAVVLVFTFAATLARKTVAAVGLGIFDRLLGGAFGFLRGALLGVAILMAISAFLPDLPWLANSRLKPYFLAGSHAVSFVVPGRLQEEMAAGAAHLLQQTPQLLRPATSTDILQGEHSTQKR